MAWQDEIAQKRTTERQLKSTEAFQTGIAKSQDIDSLIHQVKEVQLAAMLGNGKSTVILTDQTDLGDKMSELADKVAASIKQLDSSDTDKQEIAELKSLYVGLTQLKTTFTTGNGELSKGIQTLVKAVNALQMAPVVNLPAPKVSVDVPKLDLQPLQDTIKEYFKVPETPEVAEKVDLECYRAQDITESGDMQYVGFVNPDGGWYIIENDTKSNSLRYVFGNSGYSKAFARAAQFNYALLNEAVDALTT